MSLAAMQERFGDSVSAYEEDGWIHLARTLPGYEATYRALTRALSTNAALPGLSKLALARTGAVEARAELPLAPETGVARHMDTIVDGFRVASGTDITPRRDAHEPIDLDDVEALLIDIGKQPRRASETKLVIPLPAAPPEIAELEATLTGSLRLSVAIAETEAWPDPSRRALAVFLMRVNATVRLARAVVESGAARFEVSFVSKPSEDDLAHALVALDAVTYFHIREARALEDEALARIFLTNNNPKGERNHEHCC